MWSCKQAFRNSPLNCAAVVNSFWFALSFTVYIVAIYGVIYCGAGSMEVASATWYTNTANSIFWFHYGKAVWNIIWGSLRNKYAPVQTLLTLNTPFSPICLSVTALFYLMGQVMLYQAQKQNQEMLICV